MKRAFAFALGVLALPPRAPRSRRTRRRKVNLQIHWIDVEGGAATLFVAPTGELLLFDTGNPGNGDRDAKRIYAAAQKSGAQADRPRRDQPLARRSCRRAGCALEDDPAWASSMITATASNKPIASGSTATR